MKKAIIFGSCDGLKNVYTDERIARISNIVSLYPHMINQLDFSEHISAMEYAEIIFTSYGINSMSSVDIIKLFPNAKILLYAAGSVQRIARGYLDCGIEVISAWAANAVPVSEFVAAQIVLANKGYFHLNSIYKNEGFRKAMQTALSYPANRGARVGILGAGMIGKKVISLIERFGVTIYVYDPFLTDEEANALGVQKADLDFIFKHCHTISNHIANFPETEKILTEKLFCSMLPSAIFINTGRGAQVDHNGLIKALRQEPGRFALLDVTDPEPLERNNPIWNLPNISITPHISGTYKEAMPMMVDLLIDETIRYINNETRKYSVTHEMLKTMA